MLTGCRKGRVRQALVSDGAAAAAQELAYLEKLFGAENVYVELFDHGDPLDGEHNDALAALSTQGRRHQQRALSRARAGGAWPR